MSFRDLRASPRTAGTAAMVVVLLVLPLLLPGFLVFQASLALAYAMAILGINLTLGYNGQVSLAQGAFFAAGAYTAAILMSQYDVPYVLALPAGAGAAALMGLLIGLPALRLPGLQLAILTFALAAVVPQVIIKLSAVTQGVNGIALEKPATAAWFSGSQDQWVYWICLACLLGYMAVVRRLLRGDSGRVIRALRDNPLAAVSLGVDAVRVRLAVFTVSAAFAGLGGGLFAMTNAYINPDSFHALRSIDFIIAAVVGGLTSIWGALIGAVFVVFIPDLTAEVHVAAGALIYGLVLLAVVLLAPAGAAGLLGPRQSSEP